MPPIKIRSTSFGIGEKILSSAKKNEVPSPTHYRVVTEFEDEIHHKKRGFSFGYGRQIFGSPLEAVKLNQDIPGPGQYKSPSSLRTNDITLKSRLPDTSLTSIKLTPGPGSYDPPSSINGEGRYISSKYLNSRCTRFDPTHKHEVTTPRYPGPGECNQ